MPMPHLENCPHNDHGWCLACVKKLWEEKEKLVAKLLEAEEKIRRRVDSARWRGIPLK